MGLLGRFDKSVFVVDHYYYEEETGFRCTIQIEVTDEVLEIIDATV